MRRPCHELHRLQGLQRIARTDHFNRAESRCLGRAGLMRGGSQNGRRHAMALASEFADRIASLNGLEAVASLLDSAVRDLGFRYFALVQHDGHCRRKNRLFLQNYPSAWVESFEARALHRIDPVQCAAAGRLGGFGWRSLPQLIALSSVQRDMLGESRRAGLGEGFTVPLHGPAGMTVSCSFVTAPAQPLPVDALLAAECVAHSASAVAMRLVGPDAWRARLTPRQRECVALMAQGKTDWEIGRILGLSEESVTKYLNAARRRFGVARRTQLALAAIACGEIPLDEIVSWQ